jgi:hypothetical protein
MQCYLAAARPRLIALVVDLFEIGVVEIVVVKLVVVEAPILLVVLLVLIILVIFVIEGEPIIVVHVVVVPTAAQIDGFHRRFPRQHGGLQLEKK